MAEAIAIIGLAASIASLIDAGTKIVARLRDIKSNGGHTPTVFQDIANQLPLLLEIIQNLQSRVSHNSLSQDAERSLFRTVNGCVRQISEIKKLIEKWLPSPQESSLKRVRKAFGSVHSEKKIMEALRILEMYKTTLHIYSTSSARPASPQPDIQTLYDLPSKQISHFVGRHEVFRELAHHLENTTVTLSDQRCVVLIGMGGQGKTQIALEYCRRAQAERTFKFIFWIDASTENALIRSYGKIAENMTRSRGAFLDDKSRVSYVKEFFGRSCDSWIFVLDNFDRPDLFHNVKDYFPSGSSGAYILTSRHAQSERLGTPIAVSKMTEDESIELLLQRARKDTTQENIAQAKAIAQRLGYFPLALDQAGSYLSSRRLPLDSFLEHYVNRRDVILKYTPALWEYRKRLNQSENETSISAFTTWEMSLEQVGDGDERQAISHFLTLSAFLDSTNLGDGLFRDYLVSQPQPLSWTSCLVTDGHWDGYKFQDLVASLHALSLVEGADFGSTETRFSLHPLIKDWLRLRLPKDKGLDFAREAIQQVATSIESQSNEVVPLETRRMLISHIDACMDNEREIFHGDPNVGLCSLEDSASAFASTYNAHGRFGDARSLYASLLDYQKEKDSPQTLQTAMNLANALRNQCQFEKAEKMYKEVLEKRTRHLGPSHVDTLRALEGLAVIHSLQERLEEAEEEYQRLFQDREKKLGGSSADTIRAIEGLANIRRHQLQYGEAEALYGRALQVQVQNSGPRSIDTLRCVEGLAIVYRHQGRLEESIHLYQEVLKHLELIFGIGHPSCLRTAMNLSIAYVYQGTDTEAESMAMQAHQGFEELLGPGHMETKRAAEQLAEARGLKTKKLNDVLSHRSHRSHRTHGPLRIPQMVSWAALEELRWNSKLESVRPRYYESLPPIYNQLTEVHGIEQSNGVGPPESPESEIGLADLSINAGFAINKDDEPSRLIELNDDQGRKKLKSSASGNEDFPGRYYRKKERYGSPLQLFAAIGADLSTIVSLLLENYGIGPDIKNKDGQTPLSRAAENGFTDYVSFLLERNDILVDCKCVDGCTPLMYAAMGGHEQIIRILLERNDVDADAQDSDSQTPLIHATRNNHIGAAKILLSSKTVNVNSQDNRGRTSLMLAVENGNADLVKMLLDFGAQQIKPTIDGTSYRDSPLRRACSYGYDIIVEALVAKGNPDSESVNDSFLDAIIHSDEKIARLLLKTGLVEISKTSDEDWSTPLSKAATQGSRDICALLLDSGADVSTKDIDGETPLRQASSCGHADVVELLLQHGGADVDAEDGKGLTPLSCAIMFGEDEVVKHLLDAGAKIELEKLEALEIMNQDALEKHDGMLQMVRDAQNARILAGLG